MDRALNHSDALEALNAFPGLQLIYETAPIGLAFLSTDCRYLMINQHLTEICGISIGDHIGRSVRETVPQVAAQVEQIVKTIVLSGEPITGVEVNGQRPDGSNAERVWVTYWHPLKGQNGEVVGINVAAEEITDRKRIEADFAASQEHLQRLNNTLAERVAAQALERDRIWKLSEDLFVVLDRSGTILNTNPAWVAMLGWPREELVGNSIELIIHPDDRERSRDAFASLIARRGTPHFENRMLCKDVSFRQLSWVAVPDREVMYAVGRDITALKQTQEQLNALRRQLALVSRQTTMGAMTATIAHEVKQPLAAIVTSANAGLRWLERRDPDLGEAREAFERIVRDGHRLNDVIASVRAMFEKNSGEASLVNLSSVVDEVLALAQGELDAHQIVLRRDASDRLPPVKAERVQLQQVFLNLIINAVEAMTTVTGRERQLIITSGLGDNESLKVAIEDSGSGIEAGHFERIFDPFFTTKSHGMGLGLSICRSILEAHGGTLLASPRSPFGTVFQLTLPVARAE